MKKGFIDTIKSRGYWRINFQPLVDSLKLDTLGKTKEIVENNKIRLRGWDYPHVPNRNDDHTGLDIEDTFYRGWTEFDSIKEFWHMYQSGQFLHYSALREDWFSEDGWQSNLAKTIKPMSSLSITGSLTYHLTEVFEFLSRLTQNGIYEEGVLVSIKLCNTKDRELWVSDPMRGPLYGQYKTSADNIEFTKEYSAGDIIGNPSKNALECIIYFCDRFGWHRPPIEVFEKDQEKLLSGKL